MGWIMAKDIIFMMGRLFMVWGLLQDVVWRVGAVREGGGGKGAGVVLVRW
jgi:hypothetical protein